MFNKLHIPVMALLISLFSVMAIFEATEAVSAADQSTNDGKILKKEQKNQRRMNKKKKERKPATSRVVVVFHDAENGPMSSQKLT